MSGAAASHKNEDHLATSRIIPSPAIFSAMIQVAMQRAGEIARESFYHGLTVGDLGDAELALFAEDAWKALQQECDIRLSAVCDMTCSCEPTERHIRRTQTIYHRGYIRTSMFWLNYWRKRFIRRMTTTMTITERRLVSQPTTKGNGKVGGCVISR